MSKFFRRVLPTALATLLLAGTLSAHAAEVKGVLTDAKLPADATYNGIVVPEGAFTVDPNNGDPVTAPYLVSKDQGGYAPELINIDRGRQLFIDDFLIEETNLNRTFYSAIQNSEPVFEPETKWEITSHPSTAATSGGIWYDMEEKIYKMWYEAGFNNRLAYATSTDGIHWERPAINSDGSNLLVRQQQTDSFSIWLDYGAEEGERYKMMIRSPNVIKDANDSSKNQYDLKAKLYVSANGINWKYIGETGNLLDRSTFFYNPFTEEYVFSIRGQETVKWGNVSYRPRLRLFNSASTFLQAGQWEKGEPQLWIKPDSADKVDTTASTEIPQLYNFDAIAYESVMLGFHQMWYGPENDVIAQTKNPKITELQLGFSRDGFHFDRPNRNAFIAASRTEGTWDYGYLQSATGGVIVYDDEIRIYYSGFSGDFATDTIKYEGAYLGGSVGYASLRRDGFASMNGTGTLLTKPMTVTKDVKYLFVNANTTAGALKAEILDKNGNPLEGYTMEDCVALTDNTCKVMLSWGDGKDLSMLQGKEFRIRFSLENGELYSFWLAPDEKGESNGEMAAGYVSSEVDTPTTDVETNVPTESDTAEAIDEAKGGCNGCSSSLSTVLPAALLLLVAAWHKSVKTAKRNRKAPLA